MMLYLVLYVTELFVFIMLAVTLVLLVYELLSNDDP